MKYFSREWHSGDISEGEVGEVRDRYWAFIASISDSLPEPIRELATAVNLHDGLVQELVVDHQESTVAILLRCGDLQVGYFDVRLVYSGVPTRLLDVAMLKETASEPESELLDAVVDLAADG